MTPFLSKITPHGFEVVRRLRDATTREEFDDIVKDTAAGLAVVIAGGAAATPTDSFALLCAAAERMTGASRARAAAYEGAAQSAMSARAYREALFALERAEEAQPCLERRKQIELLRQAIHPAAGDGRKAEARSSTRTGKGRRP